MRACARACVRARVCALRIVSMETILRFTNTLPPSLATACKISGLKSAHIHRCKQYIWWSCNKSTVNTVHFDRNTIRCSCEGGKKALTVSSLALLLVVFVLRFSKRGRVRVNFLKIINGGYRWTKFNKSRRDVQRLTDSAYLLDKRQWWTLPDNGWLRPPPSPSRDPLDTSQAPPPPPRTPPVPRAVVRESGLKHTGRANM